jgi:serine/threonine protein kinase
MTEKDLKTQKWQVMGESFELENRFKIVDYLGSGAYGVVCAVNDSLDNKVVAIKKCKKIFQSRTLAKRTLREVRLLRLFNHENIVKLKTILIPDNSITFTELYVVFELMETDLAQIIRSPQKLKEQHTQYFTYQLLQALKYLHSENVVHRDIK